MKKHTKYPELARFQKFLRKPAKSGLDDRWHKYTHSAIISQIAKNFNFYHTDKSIKLMRADHLVFLYKYDYLEVMSEDQVLISFINWFVENQGNLGPTTVSNILDNIRWNHVTIKTLHKVMIQHKCVKENPDMKRIFKNELERRIRELLQERDSSEMYGVYLQRREPRRSYINFLRPETTTFLFDFLFAKLLEVEPEPAPSEPVDQCEDTVVGISRNSSFDRTMSNRKRTSLNKSQETVTRQRYRDRRKQHNNEVDVTTPRKESMHEDEDDKLSDEDGMNTMFRKLTPITDKRKSKMTGLFKDQVSDGPEELNDDEPKKNNKHAYKGPPNIPNGSLANESVDQSNQLNDPRQANSYKRRFEGDESSNSVLDRLFDHKKL